MSNANLGMGTKARLKAVLKASRLQLTSRIGKCKSFKNWLRCLGWSLTLLKQKLETTGKHALFGQYNVLNKSEFIANNNNKRIIKLINFF